MTDFHPHWYALSVYGNKVLTMDETLRDLGFKTYVPVVETLRPYRDGKARKVTVPAVSRLMFVHSDAEKILGLEQDERYPIHIYRTLETNPYERKLIVIPDRQMQTFMLVSGSNTSGLEYFSERDLTFKPGSHVRVIDGPFKGCEGHIKRIKGNRRLVVEIEGICAVATGYIPSPFLEYIPD